MLVIVATLMAGGCSRRPEGLPVGVTAPAVGGATRVTGVEKGRDESFVAPSPETLDGLSWIDRPVRDALAVLREELAAGAVADERALAEPNDSPAANARILAALARPPADGEADDSAVLVRHLPADPASLNPILRRSPAEFEVIGLTELRLFSFDRRLEPFAMAETVGSWQTSADGLVDRVVLRDDLVWSDGEPITAHDVAFSYAVIMDDELPLPSVRDGTDQLRAVEAYDDRTVVFFHRERLATNVWNLNFPVIPRHVHEATWRSDPTFRGGDPDALPVCGGPYVVAEWRRGERIILERRDTWSTVDGRQVREIPHFRQIHFRILADPAAALGELEAGGIDEMLLSPEQWLATRSTGGERWTRVSAPEWTVTFFAWNIESPFFADRRVRRALTFAFDHGWMLRELCHGLYEPATGPFHEASWAAPRKRQPAAEQDPQRAQQLLDDAGWVDSDDDGVRDREIDGRQVPFEFTMLVADQPLRVRTCERLREDLARIGVRMHVDVVDSGVLADRTQARRFEAWHGSRGAAADPDATERSWTTGGAGNLVGYSNPLVDALYEEGRRELDRAKRGEKYGKIQERLWEDQPFTWLYWRNGLYGFSRDLRGVVFSPRGPFTYSPGTRSLWRPR
jgi:peptide/nickel transport system substrate-binding protein